MISSTLWFQDRPLNHTFLPVHSPHLTQVLNLYNVMLFSRTLHWPHMDLGDTKRAISSVEPDSNHYSQRYLSVCASSACGSTSTSWAKTEKREDAKRLIRVKRPRPKRHCEATVPLREREQRLTWAGGGPCNSEVAQQCFRSLPLPYTLQTTKTPPHIPHHSL